MKSFIPYKIYYVLAAILIVIFLLFYFHFGIDKFSLKDISLSLFVEVLSISISLIVVDRLIQKYEKSKWSELDKRIKDRLINYLTFAYNIIFLHSKRMEEWIVINNSDSPGEAKIKEYMLTSQNPKINDEYLKTIVEDSYLSKWYYNSYTGMLNQMEIILKDFQTRLDHNQLPLVLDLKTILPNIASNMEHFHRLNEYIKSENMKVQFDITSSIKYDLLKIISLTNSLAKTII